METVKNIKVTDRLFSCPSPYTGKHWWDAYIPLNPGIPVNANYRDNQMENVQCPYLALEEGDPVCKNFRQSAIRRWGEKIFQKLYSLGFPAIEDVDLISRPKLCIFFDEEGKPREQLLHRLT